MCCFTFNAAQAENGPGREARIYTIYDIEVDQTSRTVNQARRIALLNGQREALQKFFAKVLRPEDVAKLPYFDDRQVRELISGFEIQDERNSSVRYIATMTVHFSQTKIYDLLSLLRIPFAESLSKPITILPVLERDGAYFLWQKENEWKQLWDQYEGLNHLVQPAVPPSELSQRLLINGWQAYDGLEVKLADYAKSNNLETLVVAIASLDRDIVYDRYRLTLTLRQGIDGQIVHRETLTSELGEDILSTEVIADLYQRAIEETMAYLDNQWREKVLVQFGVASRISMKVRINGLDDWVTVQDRLRQVSLIREYTVGKLALDHAEITISHSGDLDQLFLTMAQQGFVFEIYWNTPEDSELASEEIILSLERGLP